MLSMLRASPMANTKQYESHELAHARVSQNSLPIGIDRDRQESEATDPAVERDKVRIPSL